MSAEERYEEGLGKAIAMRRVELGLKRRELAERANLSYPYISEIENGVKEPSGKALRQIAEALELKVTQLAAMTERLGDDPSASLSILLQAAPTPEAGSTVEVATPNLSFIRSPSTAIAHTAPTGENDAPRPRSPLDDQVRSEIRAELDRFLRVDLPAIVQLEVDRQVRARLEADGAES